jgi:hypothetical protein
MDATPAAVSYQAKNPARPPDWRWRHARHVVGQARPPSPTGDHACDAVVAYLAEEAGCRTDADWARWQAKWADLHTARRLASAETPPRWAAQALLLAGQGDVEIAARCGLDPDAVHSFEGAFFNVRDRLQARDWVAACVIGPGLWRGFTRAEVGRLWMAFAYHAGVIALDAVAAACVDDGLVEGAHGPRPGAAGPVVDDHLRRSARLAVLAMMLPAGVPLERLADFQAQARRLQGGCRAITVPALLAEAADQVPGPADLAPPATTSATASGRKAAGSAA